MNKAFMAPGLLSFEQFGENSEAVAAAVEELGVFTICRDCSKKTTDAQVAELAKTDQTMHVVELAKDLFPISQTIMDAINYARYLGID